MEVIQNTEKIFIGKTCVYNKEANEVLQEKLTEIDNKVDYSEIPNIVGNLATNASVDDKIAALINSAPETLDTLQELSQALDNDPNFAATVMEMIGKKLGKDEANEYITNNINNRFAIVTQAEYDALEVKDENTFYFIAE